MKKILLISGLIMLITATVSGQIDYNTQIQPIFNTRCTSCHGGSSGLFMEDYAALMSSIGAQYGFPMVWPGDTAQSPLWDKINPGPAHGSRMPPQGSLPPENISTIGQWILEGALPMTAVDAGAVQPAGFRLISCYPNPFNPATAIRVVNQHYANIRLTVYDVHGRIVRKQADDYEAGYHDIPVDLKNEPSGMYVVLMEAVLGDQLMTSQTQKLILLK